jgi:hypothetical protein
MKKDLGNVVDAVVKAALNGDMTAAKIILDRVAPARRFSPFEFRLRLTQQFSMRLPMVL